MPQKYRQINAYEQIEFACLTKSNRTIFTSLLFEVRFSQAIQLPMKGSDEGLTLETSAFVIITVANLPFQICWYIQIISESAKIRFVYAASAKANASVSSLNEGLEIGPPLQNRHWNALIRTRFYPVAIAGDLKQAFCKFASEQKTEIPYAFIG